MVEVVDARRARFLAGVVGGVGRPDSGSCSIGGGSPFLFLGVVMDSDDAGVSGIARLRVFLGVVVVVGGGTTSTGAGTSTWENHFDTTRCEVDAGVKGMGAGVLALRRFRGVFGGVVVLSVARRVRFFAGGVGKPESSCVVIEALFLLGVVTAGVSGAATEIAARLRVVLGVVVGGTTTAADVVLWTCT